MQTYNSFNELAAAQMDNVFNMVKLNVGTSSESTRANIYKTQLEDYITTYRQFVEAQNSNTDPNKLAALHAKLSEGWNSITANRVKALTDLNRSIEIAKNDKQLLALTAKRDQIIALETQIDQIQ